MHSSLWHSQIKSPSTKVTIWPLTALQETFKCFLPISIVTSLPFMMCLGTLIKNNRKSVNAGHVNVNVNLVNEFTYLMHTNYKQVTVICTICNLFPCSAVLIRLDVYFSNCCLTTIKSAKHLSCSSLLLVKKTVIKTNSTNTVLKTCLQTRIGDWRAS